MKKTVLTLLCIISLVGCATFKANVTSFRSPADYPNHVNLNGLIIACEVLNTPEASKEQFNVDLNAIGVLPVRLIVKNDSQSEAEIDRSQIFGILADGSMYNTYALHQSIDRIRGSEIGKGMAAGAVAGAVVLGAAGAGIGAAAGGDSNSAGTGAAIGGTVGALSGGAAGADSIAEYIHKEMWYLDWGDKAVYPGYLLNGFIFLPKAEYQRIEIGVFNISKSKMEKVVINLK